MSEFNYNEALIAFCCKNMGGLLRFLHRKVDETKQAKGERADIIRIIRSPKLCSNSLIDNINSLWIVYNEGNREYPNIIIDTLLSEKHIHPSCLFLEIHRICSKLFEIMRKKIKDGCFDQFKDTFNQNHTEFVYSFLNLIASENFIQPEQENNDSFKSCFDPCPDHKIWSPGQILITA